MKTNIGVIFAAALLLVSCNAHNPAPAYSIDGSRSTIGTGLGGLTDKNGLDKNKGKITAVTATTAGSFLGGVVSHRIGKYLGKLDKQAASQAEYYALEKGRSGQKYNWDNPSSGKRGYIIPGSKYYMGSDICRPYTHAVYTGGKKPQILKGRACRGRDGNWN